MSSSIDGQSTDRPIDETVMKPEEAGEIEKEKEGVDENEEEDEDEDFDFNPFLKGTPSPEASSSLSSEVEVFDGNSSKITPDDEVRNYPVGDCEHGEEVVMQAPLQIVPCNDNGFSNPGTGSDDEDAIWKRTRARYSLASFTLDELETFLQETDDEEDLQNVDDEEEYRKFLAAVLVGGDGVENVENAENVDDEDEDNDADFEIELEELLESDGDDNKRDEDRKREYERSLRRPVTRQNKRQKASAQYKQKLLEQTKRPLRPLLPILPNGGVASMASGDGIALVPATAPEDFISGFSPQQIGQLHCLIHEHVQLLIQVFSICILDPSKQDIASQVQGLIFDMLHKRDEGKAFRNVPYSSICFHPSYMTPSVIDEVSSSNPECTESSSTPNLQISLSQNIPRPENIFSRQSSSSQTTSSFWVPSVSGSLISVLDVAPLSLAGKYLDDVSNAAEEYRKQHLNSGNGTWNEKEPLFHLPNVPPSGEAYGEVSKGNMAPATWSIVPCVPGQSPPKKTMAASIVENTKKQSIAFVPKDISKLIQRFLPLFNTALFPHKPPPASVANRILFTDSEDELLALGMMELNTDWKAIQQRFLPCKSEHQIFVRQKNRCSSKSLENPIKTVRKMKTSPLTAEEVECIQEGLKVFKHDWTSVWRFVVPHRDPSLLPRQWRTAIGTQKSYKLDDAKREKRRKYDSNRRRCKTEDLANWQQETRVQSGGGGEKNCGDDSIDDANEAYVHQAFLADWRPDASILALPHVHHYQYPHARSQFTHARNFPYVQLNNQVSRPTPKAAKSHFPWPYPTRRTDGAHLVKLAPDLPPVNLPPTVRVISQAAFRSNQSGVPQKFPAPGIRASYSGKENTVFQLQHENPTTDSLVKAKGDNSTDLTDKIANLCPEEPEESATLQEACGTEERGAHSELQMHPLLFQDHKDGRSSYYPLSCRAGTPGSFTFFSANQPQLNLSLFHSPYQANQLIDCSNKSSKTKESASASSGIDFHPLLQRADVENSDFAAPHPSTQQSGSRGKSTEFETPFGVSQTKLPLNARASAASSKSSGPVEKSNELDLEIHLSSSSTKNKSRGSEDVGATNRPKSTVSGNIIEKDITSSPCRQHSESFPTVQSNMDPGGDLSAGPSNDDSRCNMDDIGDNSHPEIVMEQEELSDSDEETEEHVEFECEEMDDSDGDKSLDCDPTTAEVQDKDIPSFPTEKATDGTDCAGPPFEPISSGPGIPETSSNPGNDTPFLKLGLTNLGKDGSSNSWLSLDSCAPVDPPSPKAAKYEECTISVANNLAASRSNQNCKKITGSTKRVATEDTTQQLSLGPLFIPSLKKQPRKRVCRPNTGFSAGIKTENSRNDHDKPG
ncbi:Homeodomain-like superfamily protein [Euphorbia peplus]|nr:Homeodomain-like superfamily protein [Euphorbia peplus]